MSTNGFSSVFWLIVVLLFIWKAWGFVQAAGIRSPKQAFEHIGGQMAGLVLALAFVIVILPVIIRYSRPLAEQYWGGLFSEVRDGIKLPSSSSFSSSPPTFYSAPSPSQELAPMATVSAPPSLQPLLPVQAESYEVEQESIEEYEVQAGDTLQKIADRFGVAVADIMSANGIANPNRIMVGQKLQVPVTVVVTVVPTPLPTPTPAPYVPEVQPTAVSQSSLDGDLARLAQLRLDGRIDEADGLADYILGLSPNNQTALQVKREIADSRTLREQWAEIKASIAFPSLGRDKNIELLSGYTFEVVEYEERFLAPSTTETMTVRCTTPGTMYGTEIELSASFPMEYGADSVGDEFTVGGDW